MAKFHIVVFVCKGLLFLTCQYLIYQYAGLQ